MSDDTREKKPEEVLEDTQTTKQETPEKAEAAEETQAEESATEEAKGESASEEVKGNGAAESAQPEPALPSPEVLLAENLRLRKLILEKEDQLEEKDKTLREYISSHRKATQEFEAAKERLKRDIDAQVARARGEFLKGLLEVLDNLDRSIDAPAPEEPKGRALLDGVRMVREQFLKKLKENGVERIETKDQPFDPEFHDALSVLAPPDPSQDGKVAYEVRAGYTMEGKLLRPAQVVVFKKV